MELSSVTAGMMRPTNTANCKNRSNTRSLLPFFHAACLTQLLAFDFILRPCPYQPSISRLFELRQICLPALPPPPVAAPNSPIRSTSDSVANGNYASIPLPCSSSANVSKQLQLALPERRPCYEPADVHLPHLPRRRARQLLLRIPEQSDQPSRRHGRRDPGCGI